jgi:hypothetical protein
MPASALASVATVDPKHECVQRAGVTEIEGSDKPFWEEDVVG